MGRKRAAGGGRKAKDKYSRSSTSITVRMRPDLRRTLEMRAASKGHKISQEVIWRLENSFAEEEREERDRGTRAICFLLSELVKKISFPKPQDWHTDSFLFKAFKIGIAKLLTGIEPKGETRAPPMEELVNELKKHTAADALDIKYANHLLKIWKSPERLGRDAAADTLANFNKEMMLGRLTDLWRAVAAKDSNAKPFADRIIRSYEITNYGMSSARRDLKK
jgi:hypothetical protein